MCNGIMGQRIFVVWDTTQPMTCASLIRQFTKRQKRRLFVLPIKRDLAKRVDSSEARGCKEAESDLAASSETLIVKLQAKAAPKSGKK